MKAGRPVAACTLGWLLAISVAHGVVNLDWLARSRAEHSARPRAAAQFAVGFLPVTCHLTCPVTDFINRNLHGANFFQPLRFSGWPELKEMFLSRPHEMPASFILAPMAMALREQGVKIKIVYLGHRDGSALVVHKDSGIFRTSDLHGKTVAVPGRYSNQRLMLYRELRKVGMSLDDLQTVEMAPPDMPAALLSRAVDAITSGEPFMGQAELDGYGRTLWQAKDIWPGFISCVLAVHEEAIRERRDDVQRLVDGIAASGKWLDQSIDHRLDGAEFVARHYYNQDPRLLRYVLSKPPDRVRFTRLAPLRPDFEEIARLATEIGMIRGRVPFDDYVDDSFAPEPAAIAAPLYELHR